MHALVSKFAESVVYSSSRRARRSRSASDPSIEESRERRRKLDLAERPYTRASISADFLPGWIQESSRREVSKPTQRETRMRRTQRALSCVAIVSLGVSLCPSARADPSKLSPEYGYNYNEIETARAAGTAGATRTFSNSLTALFMNPANLAAARVYHLGAFAQIYPEASRQSY